MNRILIAIIILISFLSLGYFAIFKYNNDSNKKTFYGIYYGKDAPDFILRDQDGNQVSLGQYMGKDCFIIIWIYELSRYMSYNVSKAKQHDGVVAGFYRKGPGSIHNNRS